ncbi:MAG: MATE family efflux transporter, partial [Eubacterium sp.]|nr:MATE family efflux transporter [Eubacterium sp.]
MDNNREVQFKKMTETPVQKLIVMLAIPTIISMLVTSIYNMVDTAFVGQLGTSASGAVGVVFGFMAIIQAIGFMFGQGSGSILSRKLGRKDYDGASQVASTGFLCSFMCGILILVLGLIFIDPLVYLLGSTKTIDPFAKTYIIYILIATPMMISSFVLNNILRYEGKASLGMIGLLAGSILNMVGDPILMFGFGLGIAGAGLSTAISQVISFLILLFMFYSGKTQSKLSLKNASVRPSVVFDICATGFPALIRQALASVATMILNKEAGFYGDAAVAAMSIVSRVCMFVFSFALGIGQGFQPICAFNYGAGKYSRVRRALLYTMAYAEGLLVIVSILVISHSSQIIQIFRDDPEVIRIGIRALNLYCASLIFMPMGTVTEMMLQSTGYRLQASITSSLRSGLIFIPLLILLARFRGLAGIQEAQPLSYVLAAIPSFIMLIWFLRRLPREDS